MGQIVSGTIKFGRTVKTGDYENKRGDVELTFSIAEGEDPAATLDAVSREAQDRLNKILGIRVAGAGSVAPVSGAPAQVRTAEPAATPTPTARTKADLEKEVVAAAAPKRGPGRPPKPPAPTAAAQVAPKVDVEAITVEETPAAIEPVEDLGGPVPTIITDKELSDAANRVNTKHAGKQVAAIRALNAKYGGGPVPKGLRDMPQENRAAYLKELNAM